ncbi:MAG: small acid-soluble spore protein SspI [Bacilli bacterium]|jgi:small acid-soluble spore protein I (minor)|nr:small acid-soluble spore protein SspI [Acholeplasmataceae bacterium]
MDINIRKAVMANLNGATNDDVRKTIVDAINMGEEKVLPGLGVLFEVFWQKCNEDERAVVLQKIAEAIK